MHQPPEKIWRDGLAAGRFLLQRDASDGTHYFPPRIATPTGGTLEWVEAKGTGSVYSVTVVRPKPPEEPYNVVLVDLEEGPRLMSRVEGLAPDAIAIGLRVVAQIGDHQGDPLILFHPA